MSGLVLEVWLDSDLDEMCCVGMFLYDWGQVCFSYDKVWIKDVKVFMFDFDLFLDE